MKRSDATDSLQRPSIIDRTFNRLFGVVVGLGGGPAHNHLVQIRGRKSGRIYSTPINLLVTEQYQYLVAPRGTTQWVKNLRSSGELTLKKGSKTRRFRTRELADPEKPILLKEYLNRYEKTVHRYFSIPANSSLEEFAEVAKSYPIFELEQTDGPAA